MRDRKTALLALTAVAAMLLGPLGARADNTDDNEANCLANVTIVIFSGTDAGAARRGLNAGTFGCLTAGDPDVPYQDTNYLTPGATHAIIGVIGLTSQNDPGPATYTFGDEAIALTWSYLNDRWESQSIPLASGTGTVTISSFDYGTVHYEKLV